MVVPSRMRLGAWIAAGVLGGGVISGVVVSQLGTATAASGTPSPQASGAPRAPMPYGGPLHRFGGRFPGLAPLGPGLRLGPAGGRVLHGQATVQAPNGTTKVLVSQTGTITDISGSEITVKSSDAYVATYTVDKTTRISLDGTDGALSSLKNGDMVRVLGTKTGSSIHAAAVDEGG